MILLADAVLDGRDDQRRFGVIDLAVRRNGYGRQAASFEADLDVAGVGRRPVSRRVHPGPGGRERRPRRRGAGRPAGAAGRTGAPGQGRTVEGVAATQPVVCRQGPVLTTSFHPELTGDRRLHRLFLEMTKGDERNARMQRRTTQQRRPEER